MGSVVRVYPGPPFGSTKSFDHRDPGSFVCQVLEMVGAVAQLGEHLLCKQGVSGSIPLSSTIFCPDARTELGSCDRDGPASDGRRPLACTGEHVVACLAFVF